MRFLSITLANELSLKQSVTICGNHLPNCCVELNLEGDDWIFQAKLDNLHAIKFELNLTIRQMIAKIVRILELGIK